MVRVTKTARSGVRGDKIFLSLVGEDKKAYELLLPPAAAIQAAVSILGAACKLPEADALTQAQWASVFEAVLRYLGT